MLEASEQKPPEYYPLSILEVIEFHLPIYVAAMDYLHFYQSEQYNLFRPSNLTSKGWFPEF